MVTDWQRALIALSATVVGTAVVFMLYWGRVILIPVALAIFLAFVLSPVVTRVQRRGLGRGVSVITTVGTMMLIVAGVGTLVIQQVSQLTETLEDRREVILERLHSAKQWVVGQGNNRFGQLVEDVGSVIVPRTENPNAVVVETSESITSRMDRYLSPVAELLGQIALAFVLTVFMLINREDLRNRIIRLLGEGQVTATTKAVDDASQRISRFLFSQFMLNSAYGMVITVGLFFLGVKYAILWGFIAFIMRYVPYLGTWLGLIPPVLFSFATAPAWGGGWGQPVAVFLLFAGLELFCNNVIEPMLYGRSMGLSEVAQLVAAAFWAFLWGPIGLIISGPLTVCLLVLGRHVRRLKFLEVLLGDTPALEPRIAFYQRLAAHDQDEASEIVLTDARKTSPDEVFDRLVIPALCMARHDRVEGMIDVADLNFVVNAAYEISVEAATLKKPSNNTADERLRILIAPARDQVEQRAAELLALILNPNRWEVRVAGDETLASELVEIVEDYQPHVVVIATIPPGGLSHARYLVTRLRMRFPEVKILVGRWGCEESEFEARRSSFGNTDGIDRTLADTRKRLSELYPLIVTDNKKLVESASKPEELGTVNA